jgi:hypothetical protein
MKKTYKVKEKNKTKLKSYLDKKPKTNDRVKRHNTSRNS